MASETAGQAAFFRQAGKLRDAGRRRRRWCHDHARSKRRSAGMESSLTMLVPSVIRDLHRCQIATRLGPPDRPPAARRLSTFGSSMCRGRKPVEFRPYRSVEGRYVSYANRLSRGMRWFKPEKAPDRSVRSARVSRCSLRAADGARGEAWRPLTVSHGVSETGTIEYHHRVIHPGRGGS